MYIIWKGNILKMKIWILRNFYSRWKPDAEENIAEHSKLCRIIWDKIYLGYCELHWTN